VTRVLLVRHATNDTVGRLVAGWTPGVHLNEEGRAQAERLARRLSAEPLRAVYTSPLERAVETAGPIAAAHGLEPSVCDALGEIRFGEWTGLSFEALEQDERWRRFNLFRGGTRAPGGEHMLEVQARVVAWLEGVRDRHPGPETVAAVTHGDVVKAALFHYGGVSFDQIHRWEISPASVSTLELDAWGARLVSVNDTCGAAGR
jgi:broad specificity phosphatase PhoE